MDFFRTMNNASGEDLTWFWKGWLINSWEFDQAIVDVSFNNMNKNNEITLANLEPMAMPVYLNYETVSGKKGELVLPVEIWNNRIVFKAVLPVAEKLRSIEIDADNVLPDKDRSNNIWRAR